MSALFRGGLHGLCGLALVAGVCVQSPATPHPEVRRVALLSGQGPVLDLIMSGSGYPIPPPGFVDAADNLYLEPLGLAGTPSGVITPELYTDPTQSMQVGADVLVHEIATALAQNPDTTFNVFGYSQSASLVTPAMNDLHNLGIAPDQVRFVMAGDPSTPNGGLLNMLDVFPLAQFMAGIGQDEVGLKTPDDLYPADVYGLEYDGFVDFPKYPLNLFSTINALFGLAFRHLAYLGLTRAQIDSAITLPAEGDSLVTYHLIPSELVPILAPLLFIPTFGQPLYDLLAPDARILANLGYGSIDQGWNAGPVNVPQVVDLSQIIPADINRDELFTALTNGWNDGVHAFVDDLDDLKPAEAGLANDLLQPLVRFAQSLGALDPYNFAPSLLEFLGDNVVAERNNEEYFFAHYSTLDIPNYISFLFGTPDGFLLLTNGAFPDFTFDLN